MIVMRKDEKSSKVNTQVVGFMEGRFVGVCVGVAKGPEMTSFWVLSVGSLVAEFEGPSNDRIICKEKARNINLRSVGLVVGFKLGSSVCGPESTR